MTAGMAAAIGFGKVLPLTFFPLKSMDFENEMFLYLIKKRIIQNTWGLSHLSFFFFFGHPSFK